MSRAKMIEVLRGFADDGDASTHYSGCWEYHPRCAMSVAADMLEESKSGGVDDNADRLRGDLVDLRDYFQFVPYKTYDAALDAILSDTYKRSGMGRENEGCE